MARKTMTKPYRIGAAVIAVFSPGWTRQVRRIGFGVLAALAVAGSAGQAAAADGERFEITSIKAVRPTLADTVAALQKRDVARAKAAFAACDSAWNGIEVYVNTRSKDMYDLLEHNYQSRIAKALDAANPDAAALLPDAQVMLAKYDELIGLVTKAAPLNPLYDDIARLRMVRAHLREVIPAMKAGDVAKARKSFEAFNTSWDRIEDQGAFRRQLRRRREGHDGDRAGAHAGKARPRQGHGIGERGLGQVQRKPRRGRERGAQPSVELSEKSAISRDHARGGSHGSAPYRRRSCRAPAPLGPWRSCAWARRDRDRAGAA
jgi:hypothetical protein